MSFTRARAFVTFGVLFVIAIAAVVVALVRDTQGDPGASQCRDAVLVNMAVPSSSEEVRVRVLNATGEAGLAESVSTDLHNRGFLTEKPGQVKQQVKKGVAILRYGPEAFSGAWLIRAYFLDDVELQYDIKRKGAVVDVVVGGGYMSLATPTEVNQSIKEIGAPELPAGSCAAPVKAAPAAG